MNETGYEDVETNNTKSRLAIEENQDLGACVRVGDLKPVTLQDHYKTRQV